MFCNKCDHRMKFLITESNKEKEVWKCMKCGYKEEVKLWDNPKKKKGGN